jgi:hypothetical protein
MSLLRAAAFVAVPGLSFTWRMNLPVPCNKRVGSGGVSMKQFGYILIRSGPRAEIPVKIHS